MENIKEVLIYSSTRLSIAAFIKITAMPCCNIHSVSTTTTIFCIIYSFILTAIIHFSIQAEISHPAREIVNILTIANSRNR